MIVSDEPVRWITGRRGDGDDPGGPVGAIVYRPMQQPEGEYGTRTLCPSIIRDGYIPSMGVDELQCRAFAVCIVLELWTVRGVRDCVVSRTPPDDFVL